MFFREGNNVASKSTQTEPQLYDQSPQTSCSVEDLSAQLSSLSHQIPSSAATSAGPVSSDVAQIPAAGSAQHVANRCPRDYEREPTMAAMVVPCRPKPYLPHVVLAGIAVRNLDPDNYAGRLYCCPLSLSVSNRCLNS